MTKKFFGVPSILTSSLLQSTTEPEKSSQPSDGKPTDGASGGLDQLIADIIEWMDGMDARFVQAMRRSRPETITCDTCPNSSPGCCYQKVFITFMEVIPIVDALRKSGRDTPEFRERLRIAGIEMEAGERYEFFQEGHPCVFLNEGRCSIYSVRPGACRSYYVISEPNRCQPGDKQGAEDGIYKINDQDYSHAVLDKGMAVNRMLKLKETPKRIMMATLPRMVLIGLQTWDEDDFQKFLRNQVWPSEDNLEEWMDGETPFREQLYQIRKKAP